MSLGDRRTRWSWMICVVLGAVLITGCRTFNVRSDWDPTADLMALRQYHFVEPPETEGENPFADNTLLRKRLRHAIETVLAERGYPATENPEEADFLVTYAVLLDEQLRVDGVSTTLGGYPYRYGRRGLGFGTGFSTAQVRAYQESTLLIDILDPSNRDLVWRGWSEGIVGTRDRDRGEDRLHKGVKAILASFPPGRDR